MHSLIGRLLIVTATVLCGQSGWTGEPITKDIVFLVPGTMNSLVPSKELSDREGSFPYFSPVIVAAIEQLGHKVFIIDGLKPLATNKVNGQITAAKIRQIYKRESRSKKNPVTIIGHSAGGLWALYAATKLENIPINRIILAATPLKGSRLADLVFDNPLAEILLNKALDQMGWNPLDVLALCELTHKRVHSFINDLRLPPHIRVFAAGGSQPIPHRPTHVWDTGFLSLPLAAAALIEHGPTDGLVTLESAYGVQVKLYNQHNRTITIQTLESIHAPLDHFEQLLNSRLFEKLGFSNARKIDEEQRKWYSQMLLLTE